MADQTDAAELPTRYLPDGLRRIATYAGWDAMWALWEAYAGGRVMIPKSLDGTQALISAVGHENAHALVAAFAGEWLNVPKGDAARRAIRDKAIRAERANGVTTNAMCKKYQLTYRQLQTIFRGIETGPPEETLDFFSTFCQTTGEHPQ